MVASVLAMLLALWPAAALAEREVPRGVLALWSSKQDPGIRFTLLHRYAEMPLNHLGLMLRYHDLEQGPPPPVETLGDVRGVILWFPGSEGLEDPSGLLDWMEQAAARGKRLVVLGDPNISGDRNGRRIGSERIDRFWSWLGLKPRGDYIGTTFDVKVAGKDALAEFERPLTGVLPGFEVLLRNDPRIVSHLTLRRHDDTDEAQIVTTGPGGGYAAPDYAFYRDPETQHTLWRIDPFAFFRLALATDDLPKPDATTLSGRRIYYSHVDGDGWRNQTEVLPYAKTRMLSAEVLLHEVVQPYPDLPVTIAPIAADLDPAWKGGEQELAIARVMLALPQVEAGSHTYSHPFAWIFFADYTEAKERPFRKRYEGDVMTRYVQGAEGAQGGEGQQDAEAAKLLQRYFTPRAYGNKPFDLDHEIAGSLAYIQRLLPPGKRVEVLQWSGDCIPFPAAIRATRLAGVRNLNGGDTRFDPEFPSVSAVSPLGRGVDGAFQVYASASNENTYTNLWTSRFYGQIHLAATVRNTESPRRLKPFNLYYHVYSGDKLASLVALKRNLDLARASELAPVAASHFAAIADGAAGARLIELGPRRWRVEERGELQTIRFDDADRLWLDPLRSAGVLGARRHQGSLYVALDAAEDAPVIALADTEPAPSLRPFLVQSRWRIWDLATTAEGFSFAAQGFGRGEMEWRVEPNARWRVEGTPGGEATSDSEGRLTLDIEAPAYTPVRVTLARRP